MASSKSNIASTPTSDEPLMSAEAYFQLEESAEDRHEFDHGKLLPMSGESIDANQIGQNFAFYFENYLGHKGFHILRLSVKLRVLENRLYRYPDVMVVPSASIRHSHEITEPTLIIEITSEESEIRDRKTKLSEYTSQFNSLRYYVIVDQYEPFIQVYSRTEEGLWQHAIFQELTAILPLPDLDTSIPLSMIYHKVSFLPV
jgi:Uma2 family endonuclease